MNFQFLTQEEVLEAKKQKLQKLNQVLKKIRVNTEELNSIEEKIQLSILENSF